MNATQSTTEWHGAVRAWGKGRARAASFVSLQTKRQPLPPCTVNRSLNFQCEVIKCIKLSYEMDTVAPTTFLALPVFPDEGVGQSVLPSMLLTLVFSIVLFGQANI